MFKSRSLDKEIAQRENKYKISPVFWEDYSRINMSIYLMDNTNKDKVWHQIDVFSDKYSQYIELKTYNQCIETLIANYRRRQEFL